MRALTLSLLASLSLVVTATPAQETATAAPAKEKVHRLRPAGSYADLPEAGLSPIALLSGGAGQPKPFYGLVDTFRTLAKDAEVRTLLLDLSGDADFNFAQVRELERSLGTLRQAGKRVIAYLEHGSSVDCQLAALCDRVVMADMGMLDLRSPAMQGMHFKDALDLLGIEVEVVRVGDFKGAVEPFTLPRMSDHLRDHYERMLRSMNQDIVRRVATGRGMDPARVADLQATRLFTGKQALEAGLVDRLVPWEGAERALAAEVTRDHEVVDAEPKKKPRRLDLFSMLGEMFRSKRDDEKIEAPKLVVMHLSGPISDGDKASPGSIVSGPAVKEIDALAENEHVRGVVVRVNSPGGSATASEAVRRALERLAAKKPVVFSMGDVAGSGGYWITCIGRPILAEPGTITGSIGVFSMRFQPGALMRRLGVHTEMIALDEGAAMDAMDRPWSDAARGRMQSLVDDIYQRFVGLAAESRRMKPVDVRPIAGGRVWSGLQAVDLGLVDAIGGLDDALAMVRAEASVGDDVEVLHRPEPADFGAVLMESLFSSGALARERTALGLLVRDAADLAVVEMMVRDALGGGVPRVQALMPTLLRVR